MLTWLWDNAVTVANIVMAIAAVAALIYAHLQIGEGRKAERRANAHELWRETLRLAFDNPAFSDPTLKLVDFDYENRTIDGSVELFQKYELYVDTILNASEEILDVSPGKEWRTAVRVQLSPHRDYLNSAYFKQAGYLEQYTAKFRTFVAGVLKDPFLSPPLKSNIASIEAKEKKAKKRA